MSSLIVIVSTILITLGIYLLVNSLGAIYDNILDFSINKLTVIIAIDVITGIILIGTAIFYVVELL